MKILSKFTTAGLVILIAAGSYYWYNKQSAPMGPGEQTVPVLVKSVIQKDMPINATTYASLYSQKDAELTSESGGTVTVINFTEGAWVETGEALIVLNDAAEKAAVAKAIAEEKQSEVDYKRKLTTFKSGATPKQELDQAEAVLKARQANLALAKAELAKKHIKAPFAGRLGAKHISLGDYIAPGKSLVEIVNAKVLKVRYSLPEVFIDKLEPKQIVRLSIGDGRSNSYEGVVDFVAPSVDPDTRSIQVEATVQNDNEELVAGQSATVTHVLGVTANALSVPEESLLVTIEGHSVYKITKNKENKLRVQKTAVEIGARQDGLVQIIKGLNVNDQVVTEGQQKLRDGAFVVIQKEEKKG